MRKRFGPVFVDKVGVTLEHGRIKLLLDAGMDMGGFTFKMLDFGRCTLKTQCVGLV